MLKIENINQIKGKAFGGKRFEITDVFEHMTTYYFEVLDIDLGGMPTHRTVILSRRYLGYEPLYILENKKTGTLIKLTIESIKDIDIFCNNIETLLKD